VAKIEQPSDGRLQKRLKASRFVRIEPHGDRREHSDTECQKGILKHELLMIFSISSLEDWVRGGRHLPDISGFILALVFHPFMSMTTLTTTTNTQFGEIRSKRLMMGNAKLLIQEFLELCQLNNLPPTLDNFTRWAKCDFDIERFLKNNK
jgi:hypothetical protein